MPNSESQPSISVPDVIKENEDFAFLNALESEEPILNADVCVKQWKSASPEPHKKMFTLFSIARVFVSVCRHGHVLLACDMI